MAAASTYGAWPFVLAADVAVISVDWVLKDDVPLVALRHRTLDPFHYSGEETPSRESSIERDLCVRQRVRLAIFPVPRFFDSRGHRVFHCLSLRHGESVRPVRDACNTLSEGIH